MIAVWYVEELTAQDTKKCLLKAEPMKMWAQGWANEDMCSRQSQWKRAGITAQDDFPILGREKNLSVL